MRGWLATGLDANWPPVPLPLASFGEPLDLRTCGMGLVYKGAKERLGFKHIIWRGICVDVCSDDRRRMKPMAHIGRLLDCNILTIWLPYKLNKFYGA